ncbi:AAA family ATPase [Phenylobacterium sp. J367]|uniref:AAA family ATPase n=1 Tax=Phenylobacterium sp. J367 TaxID=2898435 RepID=UPI002151DDFB|nr:AAA family ATPase [Phenylobacterium sp. J367]MCR5879703.1 AAA family ATPase [Phenylobacterium sp. J367]
MSPSIPAPEPSVRLHGRGTELAAVREALAAPAARLVVARGPGGAGKTALMRAALDDARAAGALTGAGKYAQGQASRDIEPLVQAIEAALAAGLDQLFDPAAGLRDLRRALGDNAPILAGVGSGVLRTLAGTRDAGPVTAERADERLAQAVLQVLRWMEGFGAPGPAADRRLGPGRTPGPAPVRPAGGRALAHPVPSPGHRAGRGAVRGRAARRCRGAGGAAGRRRPARPRRRDPRAEVRCCGRSGGLPRRPPPRPRST